MYRGGQFNLIDDNHCEIKVFNGHDWIWETFQLRKSDIDYIKDNPLFPVVLGMKAQDLMYLKGMESIDEIRKLSPEEMDAFEQEALEWDVPDDKLINRTKITLSAIGDLQDICCAEVSKKATGCATCDNDY